MRRSMRLAWLVGVATMVWACETPITSPQGPDGPRGPASTGRGTLTSSTSMSMALLADTAISGRADSDTTGFPIDSVNTTDPWPDSVRLVIGPGDTITVRTLGGDSGSVKQIIGTDTFVIRIGIWSNGSPTNGDFIGIIYKNGKFHGFWGRCSILSNQWYITTDPATGKKYYHWVNWGPSGETYHYIYDPAGNKLKIYHKKADGTLILIYDGPPIKKKTNLPPVDPPSGGGPWTSEEQIATGTTGTGGTTPTTPGTGTTTPTGPTLPGTKLPGMNDSFESGTLH